MTLCPICQDDDGCVLTTTPCGHSFHKECLKGITRPRCPLCQQNIKQFLVDTCDLSNREIRRRISSDEDRIVHEALQTQSVDYLTDEMCLFMMHQEMQNNWENWMTVFMDVIIDRIIDARRYFANISCNRKGNGFFRYFYRQVDIEDILLNSYTRSRCQWWKPSRRDRSILDPLLITASDEIMARVKNSVQTDFGVLIIIQNPAGRQFATTCVLTTNVPDGSDNAACRVAHRDVQFSLTRSVSCRHSGHSPYDSNPEYVWARNVWKRNVRNMNKYGNNNNTAPTVTVSLPSTSTVSGKNNNNGRYSGPQVGYHR